jgi:hypothetical protein
MTTQDLRKALPGGQNVAQSDRGVTWEKTVDFSAYNAANTDVIQVMDLRAGFVFERCDVFLLTAEGGAGTIDIGISGDIDGFLDAGDVNGTPNERMASGGASATIASGTLYTTATTLQITCNAALDAAVIKIVMRGYMTDV